MSSINYQENGLDNNFPVETQTPTNPEIDILNKDLDDRRRHPRKKFDSLIDFVKGGNLIKEKAKDLSYSGIFLKSSRLEKYNINDSLTLAFQDTSGQPKKYKGHIVRKDREGIGVHFLIE
ncbi:MAG: PilZ domain-containing protein [Desulfobacteraceae bacterium]|nr:PilZ domain-containing protein [Desulfobacteraceae bacterium]